MFIDGFGISNYRSFGSDLQLIGPLKKINIFIGQNNSGKSNILLFLRNHIHAAVRAAQGNNRELRFDPLDRHLGDYSGRWAFAFAWNFDGDKYHEFTKKYEGTRIGGEKAIIYLERILKSKTLTRSTKAAWFVYTGTWGKDLSLDPTLSEGLVAEKILSDWTWQEIWNYFSKYTGGSLEYWVSETLGALNPFQFGMGEVEIVPAIRRIGDAGSAFKDYSGIGIIDKLAQLQNPSLDELSLKEQFNSINEFLKIVVGNNSAVLEIPHDRQMILVHMDRRTLPLASLGTGIHEVVIIAAAATIVRKSILCIEEPELHLHPLLQKKLVRYLLEKADNQYFITTHSAHLMDTPDASIFHVRYEGGRSTIEYVQADGKKSSICADLGYRASDLLQTNCVVWVEGPSDRIYLNHWIRALEPQLIEGLHYSVMFYGGRLLAHLSADETEVQDFISLRRLNRYAVVLIDSDRSSPKGRINDTKKRIREEFNEGPGFAWITKGREIENYIPAEILETVVSRRYSDTVKLTATGPYDHIFKSAKKGGRPFTGIDKIEIARLVAEQPAALDILDLRQTVDKLVKFIQSVNDF